MSEQQAEQSGAETGSLGTGPVLPASADAPVDRVTASAHDTHSIVEAPKIAPDQEVAKADEKADDKPKAEMPKAEPFKVEGIAADAPKDKAPKDDAAKHDPIRIEPVRAEPPRSTRELLIMSPREGNWKRGEGSFESRAAEPKPNQDTPPAGAGLRRFAAVAAMLLLAVIAGAAGGAFATIRLSHGPETATAAAPNDTGALQAAVTRIDADIVALKAGLEQTTKAGLTQFNKTSDRLERIEKAQAEPAARLSRLSEAVDRLRASAPAQAAATTLAAAAPREVTGTVTAPAGAQALPMQQTPPAAAVAATTPRTEAKITEAKTEVGRLPTVDGWVLRDVSHGSALIEGRTGLYEVFAGDPVPGLGRVEAIRKQDGRWVVVTPRGLIVAR